MIDDWTIATDIAAFVSAACAAGAVYFAWRAIRESRGATRELHAISRELSHVESDLTLAVAQIGDTLKAIDLMRKAEYLRSRLATYRAIHDEIHAIWIAPLMYDDALGSARPIMVAQRRLQALLRTLPSDKMPGDGGLPICYRVAWGNIPRGGRPIETPEAAGEVETAMGDLMKEIEALG